MIQHEDFDQFLSFHRNDGEFWVWIPYTDASGGQSSIARVHPTRKKEADAWTFHKIHYFSDEEEAFTEVTFDAATL